MKILKILGLTLLISSTSAFAQNYLLTGKQIPNFYNSVISNPKAGYGYCQENQIIMLDLVINQSKKNINKIALSLVEADRLKTDGITMALYRIELYQQILSQVTLVKIKQQLEAKGLYNLVTSVKNSNTESVLKLDSVKIDIESEINKVFQRSLDQYSWKGLPQISQDFVKGEIKDELIGTLKSKTIQAVIKKEARAELAKYFAGKVSRAVVNEVIKSTLLKTGTEILKTLGRGALIEIVTLPLHAYDLPAEGKLLESVKIIPELLINPEWIRTEENLEPPRMIWKHHCLLLSRRAKNVEYYFDKMLAKKRKASSLALANIDEQKFDPDWRKNLLRQPVR